MKVLVIGGAGYIGSHVARALLDDGMEVTVFDNMSTGREENLFSEAQFIQGDILNTKDLETCLQDGFHALIHLTALKAVGESMEKPEKYAENNLSGTINILNAALRQGVRFVVFSSSAAVYGDPEYIPVDENHPTDPKNFYGFTKLEIEKILVWYDRLRQLRFAALRYFNAAGYDNLGRITGIEKEPANLLPSIMESAVGLREKLIIFGDDFDTPDGTGVRDYIHVTDIARAHVQALHYISKEDNSLLVNLGSETGISVAEMLETARRITGMPIPAEVGERRPGDPAKLVSSAHRAKELLGWKAEFSGVENLVETSWNIYKEKK